MLPTRTRKRTGKFHRHYNENRRNRPLNRKGQGMDNNKNGQEISKTFNPIPLLNPEDDDRGLIFVPMQVDKGLLDIGDTYTGCIKVIQDTDNYGNKQSCQQSVLKLADAQEASSSLRSASAANDEWWWQY